MLLNVFPSKTNMYQACKFLSPPQFLFGILYFKFLDGVGYGWGEDNINPS